MTNFVALAYTGRSTPSSPYDVAAFEGLSQAAEEAGVDLAVVRLQADRRPGETYAQVLQRKGIRAAILRTTQSTRHICIELADSGFPCIVVGDCFNDQPAVSYICADSRQTSYQAVEHLISLGHRRIAIAISHVADHDQKLHQGDAGSLSFHDLLPHAGTFPGRRRPKHQRPPLTQTSRK